MRDQVILPTTISLETRIRLPLEHLTPSELHPINMEVDYGRISIIFNHIEHNPDDWNMILRCNKCGNEFNTIASIKVHNTWHNDINTHYDLLCPYCPQTFSQRPSLNSNLYDKICPFLKNKSPNWTEVLYDICNTNTIDYNV